MKIYSISAPFIFPKTKQQKSQSVNSNHNFGWSYSPEMSCRQATKISDELLIPEFQNSKTRINSLCDLGCGDGEATKVLSAKLNIPPKNVVGVDKMAFVHPHFNEEEFKAGDFLDYLQKSDKSFDMISLCRPDCSYTINDRLSELFSSVVKRLTDVGYFFTYGENCFMDCITEMCKEKGIKYKSKEYNWPNMNVRRFDDDRDYNLQAILIPKSELSKAF